MEGASRVFAGDFNRSTLVRGLPGSDFPQYVVTPSGAWCSLVFLTGVLTEVNGSGARLRFRLADPTGAFDCEADADAKNGCTELFRTIAVPSFLAVSGRARPRGGNADEGGFIRIGSVRVVDRAARDAWIARTADSTLQGIGVLAGALQGEPADEKARAVIAHYHTTPSDLLKILAMVESAVAGLPADLPGTAPAAGQPDPKEIIVAIIGDLQGPRGVAVDDVIAQSGFRGIAPDAAKGIVDELIREDECYQPQKGFVRLL